MEFNDGTSINNIGYIFTFWNKILWFFENENIINTFAVASSTQKKVHFSLVSGHLILKSDIHSIS